MTNDYKQLDIFGNATPLHELLEEKTNIQHGGRITKKSLFRSINGYKQGFSCTNFDSKMSHRAHYEERKKRALKRKKELANV